MEEFVILGSMLYLNSLQLTDNFLQVRVVEQLSRNVEEEALLPPRPESQYTRLQVELPINMIIKRMRIPPRRLVIKDSKLSYSMCPAHRSYDQGLEGWDGMKAYHTLIKGDKEFVAQ